MCSKAGENCSYLCVSTIEFLGIQPYLNRTSKKIDLERREGTVDSRIGFVTCLR